LGTNNQYSEARAWGQQDARDIIAKKKPRSLSDLGRLLKTLESHVDKKYPFSGGWRTAYLSGVEEELTKHYTKLTKKQGG